jgi:hypothetical protein
MNPDIALIYYAVTRLSWAIDRLNQAVPLDEAGTRHVVQNDLDAVAIYLSQVSQGA